MPHPRKIDIAVLLVLAALTACAVPGPVAAPVASPAGSDAVVSVRGQLRGGGSSPLPQDGLAIIELRDTAPPHDVIAEQRVALRGQSLPMSFELAVNRAKLANGRTYALRAAVKAGANAVWVSDPVVIDSAAAADIELGLLVVKPVIVMAFATTWDCGGQRISVGMIGDALSLQVDGRTLALRSVDATRGEKFEAVEEPLTSLWSDGQRATLVTQGKEHPPCVPVAGSTAR